nr:oligopeptide/dipeptide ABC transporter ATP-binding protein [Fusibacter ferrireducens]
MSEKKVILEIKNLKMSFNKGRNKKKGIVRAIDDVSFNILKGEAFGLVGESGCGKTTTGRTIIRLYDPEDGEIYFDGKKISGEMNKDLRKYLSDHIAMIFQDPIASLNPRMTVAEIIGEGLKLRGIVDQSDRTKLINKMLNKVGLLPEHGTRYPHEFSGGQRQRIGIARALIVNPSFIIADEPVSALDVSIQAQVINLLDVLKDELELTILFIAHDLSVVKYFCDRIGVMYFGKIVEIAPAEELYKNPVHPYTKALLSAIPIPDPRREKNREIQFYDPKMHDYSVEKPMLHEVAQDHFVYASESELKKYKMDRTKER